jgi:phosphoserine aminotransferase
MLRKGFAMNANRRSDGGSRTLVVHAEAAGIVGDDGADAVGGMKIWF